MEVLSLRNFLQPTKYTQQRNVSNNILSVIERRRTVPRGIMNRHSRLVHDYNYRIQNFPRTQHVFSRFA